MGENERYLVTITDLQNTNTGLNARLVEETSKANKVPDYMNRIKALEEDNNRLAKLLSELRDEYKNLQIRFGDAEMEINKLRQIETNHGHITNEITRIREEYTNLQILLGEKERLIAQIPELESKIKLMVTENER